MRTIEGVTQKEYDRARMEIFSERIKMILLTYKIKQIDIVRHTGFDKGQVSRWVSGKVMPDRYSAEKIVNCINNLMRPNKINFSYLYPRGDEVLDRAKGGK